MKCDVHILTTKNTNPKWLDQCLTSLENQPVDIHVLQGTKGHIGQGRARGFAQGFNPIVSFVDDDDYVLDGAFDAILEHFEKNKNVSVISTEEKVLQHNGELTEKKRKFFDMYPMVNYKLLTYMHHLVALRREVLIGNNTLSQCSNRCEPALYFDLWYKNVTFDHLDIYGYVWRQKERSLTSTQQIPVPQHVKEQLQMKKNAIWERERFKANALYELAEANGWKEKGI